jgi:hypothetical protein
MAEGPKRDARGRFVHSKPSDAETDAAVGESGTRTVDISDTVAPSVGPHTTFEMHDAGVVKQSDTDAMGLDKRRSVIGGSYSPSVGRQATLYGIFIVIIVAVGIGFKLLADKLDEPPKHIAATAPWAQPGAPQNPPANPDLGPTQGPIVSQ